MLTLGRYNRCYWIYVVLSTILFIFVVLFYMSQIISVATGYSGGFQEAQGLIRVGSVTYAVLGFSRFAL